MFLIFTIAGISALLTLFLTPVIRDRAGKFGLLDRPDGVRKRHAQAVPRVGGIVIAFSYGMAFLIALVLPFSYGRVLHTALNRTWPVAVAVVVVFITGVLDDLFRFGAWKSSSGWLRRPFWRSMRVYKWTSI